MSDSNKLIYLTIGVDEEKEVRLSLIKEDE